MRWKADLPKMPRLPKVALESDEAASAAPRPAGPPPAPSAYREKNPYEPPPAEYRAPSLLAEHKGLALLFLAALVAFALYCWQAPHRPLAQETPGGTAAPHGAAPHGAAPHGAAPHAAAPVSEQPPPQSPIYVESLPDKQR